MKTIVKAIIASAAGMLVIGATASFAAERSDSRSSQRSDYRPDYCDIDHDHRSHASNYYNYYDADRYFRAGSYTGVYKGSGLRISVRLGDSYDNRRGNQRYDNRRGDRRSDNRRGDRRYANNRRGRVVNRQSFDTRYRARIILTEEIVRGRRGNRRLVCTVKARGPEANYVSKRRMHRVANRNCSPRARVRVYS